MHQIKIFSTFFQDCFYKFGVLAPIKNLSFHFCTQTKMSFLFKPVNIDNNLLKASQSHNVYTFPFKEILTPLHSMIILTSLISSDFESFSKAMID
jgi:hypothetical protein